MRISLDFDGTLSEENIQRLAYLHYTNGDVLYVVTARTSNHNVDVEQVALSVGMPTSRIHYTEGALKVETLKQLGIQVHYDNDPEEIEAIDNDPHCKCLGILVNQ